MNTIPSSPEGRSPPKPTAIAERILPAERRRRTGRRDNTSGRFEVQAREDFDGWTRDEAPEPLATERAAESVYHPQRFARYPLRPVDQPLSRLRAWLLLLLRGRARLYGALARAPFREPAVRPRRQQRRLERELAAARYSPARSPSAPTPTLSADRRACRISPLLETLQRVRHRLSIVTKSNLVLRDLDILSDMGRDGLVKVFLSVTTLDRELARGAPRADARKAARQCRALNDAGVRPA